MEITVRRITDNLVQTIGEMTITNVGKEVFKCHTLELPWKDNKSRISCIPKGSYVCIKRAGTKAIPYEHILINDVKDRSGVCIHKGNYHTQILGCIIVGDSLSDINKDGQLDVINSGVTFNKIMKLMPIKFKLNVV